MIFENKLKKNYTCKRKIFYFVVLQHFINWMIDSFTTFYQSSD